MSADDTARNIVRTVIGASLTAAQSATQAVQDFVTDKSPRIRQQTKNAKMIGQIVVRLGAAKAGEIVEKTKRREKTEEPSEILRPEPHSPDSVVAEGPISNYSVLSAPQIIALLPTLSSDEIISVRTYEAGNRNRRTVLSAIQAHLEQ